MKRLLDSLPVPPIAMLMMLLILMAGIVTLYLIISHQH